MIVASIFRDSEAYLKNYLDQCWALKEALGDVQFVWCEGDSEDKTAEILADVQMAFAAVLKDTSDGAKRVDGGGDWSRGRWSRLAAIWNYALKTSLDCGNKDGKILLVESEIRWTVDDVQRLAGLQNYLEQTVKCVDVAPQVMAVHDDPEPAAPNRRAVFYDTHGFRRGDKFFNGDQPHWKNLAGLHEDDRCVELTTAGSMILTKVDNVVGEHWASTTKQNPWEILVGKFDPLDCVYKAPPYVRTFMSKEVKAWHRAMGLRRDGVGWPVGAPL